MTPLDGVALFLVVAEDEADEWGLYVVVPDEDALFPEEVRFPEPAPGRYVCVEVEEAELLDVPAGLGTRCCWVLCCRD